MSSLLSNFSLKTKIALPTIAVLSLSIITLVVLTTKQVKQTTEAEVTGRSTELAKRYANQVRLELEDALVSVRAMSSSLAGMRTVKELDRDAVDLMLKQTLKNNSAYFGIWTCWEPNAFDGHDANFANKPNHDKTGRYIPYWHMATGEPKREFLTDYEVPGSGEYYLAAKQKAKEHITEPYVYQVGDKGVLMATIAVPILVNNKVVGVSGIDISLGTFQKLSEEIRPFPTSYSSIFSNKGKFIAGKDPALANNSYEKMFPKSSEIESAIQAGREFIQSRIDNTLHEEVMDLFVPVNIGRTELPWALAITIPKKEAYASVDKLTVFQAIGCLATILLVAAVVIIISTTISRPLYQGRAQLEDSARVVTKNSNDLQELSEKVASASQEQAAAIQETAASLDEINAMVTKTRTNAEKSYTATSESRRAADEGQHSVEAVSKAIEDIIRGNDEIFTQIEENGKNLTGIVGLINEINEKTRVINDIVFQTKLLSFNASVEAARAGESGKGFAVVAEEVGNLAEMSGKAAQNISSLLEDSVRRVTDIVQSTESHFKRISSESQSRTENGKRVAEDCKRALSEIVERVGFVEELTKEINIAADEQSKGIIEISKAINQLETATNQTATLSEEASEHAGGLNQAAGHLGGVVVVLRHAVMGRGGENEKNQAA